MMDTGESLENMVIRQMELETLQKAMQSLTEVQRERLHLYFFEEMTTREIAEKNSVSQNVVWKSIQGAINDLKNFFE
jgi:RNA polymerase sigma-70 factor (ECF subfamily)